MNQPPTFWSLVEKWKNEEGIQEYSAYTHAKRMCANELAALVKEHTEFARNGDEPIEIEYLVREILGVPREERK